MINIAALSAIATTMIERYVSFWAAFLLPTCFQALVVALLLLRYRSLGLSLLSTRFLLLTRAAKHPPQGNALSMAFAILLLAVRSGLRFSAAKPDHQQVLHHRAVRWTDEIVEGVQRGFKACRLIICFAIFYLCYSQITDNIISQAGQMQTAGLSNDTLQSFNPIACIILGPLISKLIYPFLNRQRISFGPVARMSVGLLFVAFGMAYTAGVQQLIYNSGPCYNHPGACTAGKLPNEEAQPNQVSVFIQLPEHVFLAVGEIFGLVSLSEFAYSQAPVDLKAVMQAFENLTAATGAGLGMALSPVAKDPLLVIMYGTFAGVAGVGGLLFWLVFRRYEKV